MIESSQVLALVPARGGSKYPKDKNIRLLNGIPLLCYSIQHALNSGYIDRCIVSTDSRKYADIALEYGADVPFLRPSELAGDLSTDFEFFEHALRWLSGNEGYCPDIIVHLRPTSPLRKTSLIDSAIEMLHEHPEADSLRSVIEARDTPYKMWTLNAQYLEPLLKHGKFTEPYNMPRQKLPKVYWQNACIDITRSSTILEKRSTTGDTILPFIMDSSYSIDIDSLEDFEDATRRITTRRITTPIA